MVSILNLLKSKYMYILIFFGVFILGYSILSSDGANKKMLEKYLVVYWLLLDV